MIPMLSDSLILLVVLLKLASLFSTKLSQSKSYTQLIDYGVTDKVAAYSHVGFEDCPVCGLGGLCVQCWGRGQDV